MTNWRVENIMLICNIMGRDWAGSSVKTHILGGRRWFSSNLKRGGGCIRIKKIEWRWRQNNRRCARGAENMKPRTLQMKITYKPTNLVYLN